MDIPSRRKLWLLTGEEEPWRFTEGPVPDVGEYDVLVKLHAATVNPRDYQIPKGKFAFSVKLPVVGGCDGAGEVVKIGSKVTKWANGDRVATVFNPGHQSGPVTAETYSKGALGGTIDGVFQEYGVFEETGLVRIASNLSYLEGASLSDAGVTAWNALFGGKPLRPGEWVLTQGTGGVSLFAAQFAKAAGARVVSTTSSAAKADLLKGLGVDHVINYREDPNWGKTARRLTPGERGFDYIVEIGGTDTMAHTLDAIKFEGVVTIVGVVTGFSPPESIINALLKICTFRGIHVGSRALMEEMMAGIEANKIQPVLDKKVFSLPDLKEAISYLESQKHVGKVAVKIV